MAPHAEGTELAAAAGQEEAGGQESQAERAQEQGECLAPTLLSAIMAHGCSSHCSPVSLSGSPSHRPVNVS